MRNVLAFSVIGLLAVSSFALMGVDGNVGRVQGSNARVLPVPGAQQAIEQDAQDPRISGRIENDDVHAPGAPARRNQDVQAPRTATDRGGEAPIAA